MLNFTCKSAMACALRWNVSTYTRTFSATQLPKDFSRHRIEAPNRQFSQSTTFAYPRKDSQDRNSINRESTEYSRSGSDDQVAALDDAAFNPDITDPEPEKKKAGQDSEQNPLDVSPANPNVSGARNPNEGGGDKSPGSAGAPSERKRSSGGGSPPKGKDVS